MMQDGLNCVKRIFCNGASQPSDSNPWVLDLGINSSGSLLSASLTEGVVKVFDSSSLVSVAEISSSGSNVVSAQFLPNDPNSLLVGYGEGSPSSGVPFAQWYDIREKRGNRIRYPSMVKPGSLISLCANITGNLIAVATEKKSLIFDVRKGFDVAVRTFEDSHSELLSGISFHPNLHNYLLTSADDGLVCVFDTNQPDEMDAIVSVLSAGSSVKQFDFFGPHNAFAAVITRTEGLSLFNLGSADKIADFSSLRFQFLENAVDLNSILGTHYDELNGGKLLSVAGNDEGNASLLEVTPEGCSIVKQMNGGHSSTLRGVRWANGCIYTGSEDGSIAVWASHGSPPITQANDVKRTSGAGKMIMSRRNDSSLKANGILNPSKKKQSNQNIRLGSSQNASKYGMEEEDE